MSTLAIIDYGMGNLHSVAKAAQHADASVKVVVTDNAQQIRNADRVIFPGVGALGDCIMALAQRGLDACIQECAESKPFLGICLGMQALLDLSEENNGTVGLGIVPGRVVRFKDDITEGKEGVARLKIPHMGWNQVRITTPHALWADIPQSTRFYFVHSYYVAPMESKVVAGETEYGVNFTSAIARDNIFAVQFHPEKSQRFGLQLIKNFLNWDGASG